LRFRPAFHDLLDDPRGYVHGAKIDFLSFDARYFYDESKFESGLELERFSVIDIAALNPRNQFFKPLSWQVQVGWQHFQELPDPVRFSLNGGGGLTWALGTHTQASLLALTDIRASGSLVEDWEAGVGGEFTFISTLPYHLQFLASAKELDYEGRNASDGQRFKLGLNIPIRTPNQALRIEWEEDDLRVLDTTTWRAAWQKYF